MFNFILILYVFILGSIFGSFFNVCIYRIPAGKSVIFPPSSCGNCNTRLKAIDMIPVLSYLFLGGRCRYCKQHFSARYAVVELMTGILYAALFIIYGFSFVFIKYIVLSSFLIIIGLIDYDTTDVYFKTTISGIITGVIFAAAGYFLGYTFMQYFLGALLGGGLITVIILLTNGMGWGDVEICLLCGVFLGLKLTAVTLFFSFIFGGIIGALLIITKKKSRKDYIPFGPYIALGAFVAMLYGEKIVAWYLGAFL
ncbi:prepilin peptidase [Candidatus Clostridium stratigraminis]|uniref:Prepilin peptidase n=1 Tax=Candidatus Clostridium stratigraminis TaxID=3381661 RepID=A0ABW8T231_9CLOT